MPATATKRTCHYCGEPDCYHNGDVWTCDECDSKLYYDDEDPDCITCNDTGLSDFSGYDDTPGVYICPACGTGERIR